MHRKNQRMTRLENIHQRMDRKRVEAMAAGDVPRAVRYATRAMVIYNAGNDEALGNVRTYRD